MINRLRRIIPNFVNFVESLEKLKNKKIKILLFDQSENCGHLHRKSVVKHIEKFLKESHPFCILSVFVDQVPQTPQHFLQKNVGSSTFDERDFLEIF